MPLSCPISGTGTGTGTEDSHFVPDGPPNALLLPRHVSVCVELGRVRALEMSEGYFHTDASLPTSASASTLELVYLALRLVRVRVLVLAGVGVCIPRYLGVREGCAWGF